MSYPRIFLKVVFAVLATSISCAQSASAGGYEMKVEQHTSKVSITNYVKDRHSKGIEYAFDENSTFSKLLETMLVKELAGAAGSNVKAATSTILKLRQAGKNIEYAGKNGLDVVWIAKAFRSVAKPIVAEYLNAVSPGSSLILTLAELGTAFGTAYTYGFLKG